MAGIGLFGGNKFINKTKLDAAKARDAAQNSMLTASVNAAPASANAYPSSLDLSISTDRATNKTSSAPVEKMVALDSPLAAIQQPKAATAPVTKNDGLRDAYKAVFAQQTTNVDRQNALRSGAANRQAAETAAIGGYNAAQTSRAQELAAAQANSANLEAQQNLLDTGTQLAQAQQNSDDDKLAALLEQYGESSPELLGAVANSYATGQDVDFSKVFNEDGTVKTSSAAQKEMASIQDYYDVLNDPNIPEEQKATVKAMLDSQYSTSKAVSATASVQDVATALNTGAADFNDYSNLQIKQAADQDESVLSALMASATKHTDRVSALRAPIGSLANVDGTPVEIVERPFKEKSSHGDGYWVKAKAYNYKTGETKVVTLYDKDSTTGSAYKQDLQDIVNLWS
jgi:hypothetical protein